MSATLLGVRAPAGAVRVPPPAKKVLIVDDSAVARAVMTRVVDASDRFTVAGAAPHARAALDFLATTAVDYILLDVAMPGVDGITALPDLLAASDHAKILIVSSTIAGGAETTARALAAGAMAAMAKPPAGELGTGFAHALIDHLTALEEAGDGGASATTPARAARSAPSRRTRPDPYDIIAIGASTGGIHAVSDLLSRVPASMTLPILVTQHLPASFMPYFAAQLKLAAGRPCEVATDRLRVRPGRVILAPGDAHMRCVALADGSVCIRLSSEFVANGCIPSIDPMFASIAEVYGDRALGVVLSGMGRDGAEGACALRDAGSCVVAQDQASSVVWGMPGAVSRSGIAEAQMTPAAIGRLIAERGRP